MRHSAQTSGFTAAAAGNERKDCQRKDCTFWRRPRPGIAAADGEAVGLDFDGGWFGLDLVESDVSDSNDDDDTEDDEYGEGKFGSKFDDVSSQQAWFQ